MNIKPIKILLFKVKVNIFLTFYNSNYFHQFQASEYESAFIFLIFRSQWNIKLYPKLITNYYITYYGCKRVGFGDILNPTHIFRLVELATQIEFQPNPTQWLGWFVELYYCFSFLMFVKFKIVPLKKSSKLLYIQSFKHPLIQSFKHYINS